MHHTHYHRPTTVADAVKLMSQHGDDRLIAGGQSILPSMRLGLLSVEGFVDLSGIKELQGIRVDGNSVRIGAMTTHATVAASNDVRTRIPALATLAEGIGDRQVRNRGTIGGSVANSDPAACYPAAVLALNATIQTNARQIAADQWFKGLYETALTPGEIIAAVSFPVPEKAAYIKFKQPASRFAIVGVFVAKTAGGVRVAVTGAGSHAFRVKALEDKLNGKWAPESCDGVTVSADGLNGDLHGSAEYRAHLIPVLAKRAVAAAA
ncbi:MAG: xanthine dehydrogenase family protein subunit M [Burkholderiaceae bacterium]|jgi:carbon-monoxide dehydrogenase medium subunit|nr:xanthine dehydrogenase family protein subunit M [Burkholderiaceae bacterium]